MRSDPSSPSREPRRSEARRRKFTPEGRERLRAAALVNRPWEKTRGPISTIGKLISSQMGGSGNEPRNPAARCRRNLQES